MAERFLPGTPAWIAYNLVLCAVLLGGLPLWLPWMLAARKRRANFLRRLGLGLRLPQDPGGSPTVWVHSVSVGETLASAPFIRSLKAELPEASIVLSTVTLTGQETARKSLGDIAASICFFPFDLPFVCRHFLDRVKPDAVVILETEIWPNFLAECAGRGIPVAILNGRISERSFSGYRRFGTLFRKVLGNVSAVAAQTAVDAKRYSELRGSERGVFATGNMKYDMASPPEGTGLEKIILPARVDEARLFVAGSTHEGEEAAVLKAFAVAKRSFPGLLLVLAPRHPERIDRVERLCAEAGFRAVRRTAAAPGDFGNGKCPVLLLDTVGELAGAYANADLAFVGGSLVPVGGHNILEPAYYGVPILTGPHMDNFREMDSSFRNAGAIVTIASEGEFGETLAGLLSDPERSESIGSRGRELMAESRGATERNVSLVLETIGRSRDIPA